MTNLDSNLLQTKSVDSDELAYIKHIRMMTPPITMHNVDAIQAYNTELEKQKMSNEQLKIVALGQAIKLALGLQPSVIPTSMEVVRIASVMYRFLKENRNE